LLVQLDVKSFEHLLENSAIALGSVRKVMSQTPHGASQCDHRGITFREFVEARNDTAILLQPNMRSMMLRCRYLGWSNSLGKPGLGLRFVRGRRTHLPSQVDKGDGVRVFLSGRNYP
jgi:hypothetical protein